jgi:endo-1,4-beta-D-glucanase Y
LVEAEIRSAMIEAEVREQVMQEYNQRMLDMEALFTQNMANEVSPSYHFPPTDLPIDG